MKDALRVAILNDYPEGLRCSVVAHVPSECCVSLQVKFNSHQSSRDRLDISLELEPRELVDLIEDDFAHLREVDNLSDLLSVHIIEMMPLELSFLLNLSRYLLYVRHLCELSEGSHRRPEPFVDHLAEVEHRLAQLRPLSLHADLKECPHNSACALRNIDHI